MSKRRSTMFQDQVKEVSEKFCPKCQEYKRRDDFGRDASRPDGRYSYCKDCRKNPNRKDRIVLELAAKGLKVCSRCQKTKPFSSFDKDSSKSLGVTSRCKKCHREQRREAAADFHAARGELRSLEANGSSRCYKCKEVKPLCRFLKNKNYSTGYCRLCLDCNNRARAGYRLHRRKSMRDYTRWEVFEDDNFTCYLCEEVLSVDTPANHPASLSIDHVLPLSRGGIDERTNVRTSCLSCNQKKNDSTLEEYLLKLAS